ncbi:MAG: type II secretion system protein [Planctomycetes bacterium]|nr:type II secretion system protein [Planctomycetota bacterium]
MRRNSGFTLIELMIVISIIGLLTAALLPRIRDSQVMAYITSDCANLQWQHGTLVTYKNKVGWLPGQDGHRFVLAPWVEGIVEHTEENFDRYFTPGRRENDATWISLRPSVQRGVDPWPSLAGVTSADTSYAGRSKAHMTSREAGGNEAWLADDNEGGCSHADGTVNVLFYGGTVRTYSYPQQVSLFAAPPFDAAESVAMTGSGALIPFCRKLNL